MNQKKVSHGNVYVYSGGCTSNLLDGQRMLEYFKKNDYELVASPKDADWLVVNTCAFEKHSEDRSIKLIQELKDSNPKARIIVTGCLPAINKERMLEVHKGAYFVPKINEGWKTLDDIFKPKKASIKEVEEPYIVEKSDYTKNWSIIERYHAFKTSKKRLGDKLEDLTGYDENAGVLRIAKGCLGSCSYCAIKKARGSLKSESIENLVDRFKKGLEKGHNSFKIWAEDTGDYGKDINKDLAELLSSILNVEGNYRLEILATNPKSFVELYEKLLPSLKDKRIDSLTISVQSGSRKILKSMNRNFDLESFVGMVKDLREKAPHLIIRAHYMVGFPEESWKDFLKTVNLMVKTGMYKSQIFKFDSKPGTPAEKMDKQVSETTKEMRLQILKLIRKFGSIMYYEGNTY